MGLKSLKEILASRPVILSPMAGYSDLPYRLLCKQQGSGLSITEFISTHALYYGNKKTFGMLRFDPRERPVIIQIQGNDVDIILKACEKILPLEPDGIELNMGCSVRKIALKGAGAGLLRTPDKVKEMIGRMVRELKVPISAKIRLGWDRESLNYLEVGKIVEGEGAWCLSVHGRTRSMAFSGRADWDAIGELKSTLSIPVLGNGDIQTRDEALKKIVETGVDGVLIGRAAIGNPWIFSGQDKDGLSYEERLPVILEHLDLMCDYCDPGRGVTLFRKHLVRYLKGIPHVIALKREALMLVEKSVLRELLLGFASSSPPAHGLAKESL